MTFFRIRITIFFILLVIPCAQADEWREQMKLLVYTPRYFGPNAFPFSELRSGAIEKNWEVELRGEYHYYKGDQTKDVFMRLFIPIAKGRAGVELSGVITEDYKMTDETKEERHAADNSPVIQCFGDLVVSSFFQVLQNEKWVDLMVSANLKTASGNRLVDARYTDAASYWFDLTAGRYIYKNESNTFNLRMQGLLGFYCWMTNDLMHRQNDAFMYGIGTSGSFNQFELNMDLSGFHGYKKNGDQLMKLRAKLNYEFKKNILSLRYQHGMKDFLYDSYSVAYIRRF